MVDSEWKPAAAELSKIAVDIVIATARQSEKRERAAMNAMQKLLLGSTATIIVVASAHAGRWLSRDPIYEGAGFVQRDPVTAPEFLVPESREGVRGALGVVDLFNAHLVAHLTADGAVRLEIEHPSRGVEAMHRDQNPYGFALNDPLNNLDRLGLDVVNNSDLSAWVYISSGPSAGWNLIKPGQAIKGDTDMICPNVKGALKQSNGKYRCLKIIDCFDAKIAGKAPGPYSIMPVYAGVDAGRGNNFARKCCCAVPRCAHSEQRKKGGFVNPLTVAPTLPPDYPK